MSRRVVAVALKALGVDLAGASVSADLGGSSKYLRLIFPNVDTEIMIRMNHLRGNAFELGERRSKTELDIAVSVISRVFWKIHEKLSEDINLCYIVPIAAWVLQDEQPLVDRIM
ncbi:hypothetical protein DICVIV_14256 [Dictyocaulus viviparus]|uniref:Uncharacterized protein n=1 Tax=Dictyocaulus viviparus TaxID=29172 RepID=A0A0D8X5T6_DICVI|nr:hypothetical protein DICVIV_14256 [Dictyocaulus viviparus]